MKTRYVVSSSKVGRSAANGVFTSVKSRDSKTVVMDTQAFNTAVSRADKKLRQVTGQCHPKTTIIGTSLNIKKK